MGHISVLPTLRHGQPRSRSLHLPVRRLRVRGAADGLHGRCAVHHSPRCDPRPAEIFLGIRVQEVGRVSSAGMGFRALVDICIQLQYSYAAAVNASWILHEPETLEVLELLGIQATGRRQSRLTLMVPTDPDPSGSDVVDVFQGACWSRMIVETRQLSNDSDAMSTYTLLCHPFGTRPEAPG